MDTIRFTVGEKDVLFLCDARDTRSGFAHDATLYVDGRKRSKGHCHYLNRTWESYRYQSACLTCCSNRIDSRAAEIKENYREDNGLSRVCGKRKDDVKALCDADPEISLLRAIIGVLRTKSF